MRLILVLCLVALAPAAAASPPDPVWIRGIYDAADCDEAIGQAISLAAVTKPRQEVCCPLITLPGRLASGASKAVAAELATPQGRSPPSLLWFAS